MSKAATERMSMGAGQSTPQCQTCAYRQNDRAYPGWGWCKRPENLVYSDAYPNGFTPSTAPDGTCNLHPERLATQAAPAAASTKESAS